jgi:NAD(P)-dependent dehydrogenase (short-subunit alcohol dehydrogenase family)
MFSLAWKVAVVAGAGSVGPGWGNGKATAALLARQGAAVFAIDVEPDALAATERLIAETGGTCVAHRCDMLDSDGWPPPWPPAATASAASTYW